MLFVQSRKKLRGRRHNGVVHEQVDGLFWRNLDSFTDDVHEVRNGKVRGNQVLFAINIRDVTTAGIFLTDDRYPLRVLLQNTGSFVLSLVKGMLLFERCHNLKWKKKNKLCGGRNRNEMANVVVVVDVCVHQN